MERGYAFIKDAAVDEIGVGDSMGKNQYILIMIQSLQKKIQILDSIMQINQRKWDEFENPALDPDEDELY